MTGPQLLVLARLITSLYSAATAEPFDWMKPYLEEYGNCGFLLRELPQSTDSSLLRGMLEPLGKPAHHWSDRDIVEYLEIARRCGVNVEGVVVLRQGLEKMRRTAD